MDTETTRSNPTTESEHQMKPALAVLASVKSLTLVSALSLPILVWGAVSPSGTAPAATYTPFCGYGASSVPAPCLLSNGVRVTRLCATQDGNTDGKPCVWIDPETGDASEQR